MARRLPDPAYAIIGRVLTHPRFHPLHRRLYLWTGGRGIVGHGLGMDVLLLQTTGRSSGRPRTVPLAAIPDGDAWVVVGSFGGRDRDPGWIHNLRAEPRGRSKSEASHGASSRARPIRPRPLASGRSWRRPIRATGSTSPRQPGSCR